MTRTAREAGRLIASLLLVWAAGATAGSWRSVSAAYAADPATSAPEPVGPPPRPSPSTSAPAAGSTGAPRRALDEAAITTLRGRRLRVPIDDAEVERLEGMFDRSREGEPPHEAVDIVAPRDTPIHAVEDGTIARLFTSKAGGLTIYQFDPDRRFSYYYAHLERYAPGLAEGQRVMRGDLIGFVGTSGNAPLDTPHLHFAIFELDAERQWWSGRPLDPYLVFK
jgi:murein DD-endopeptidase MepM/ murein hydrolase activator NlpD